MNDVAIFVIGSLLFIATTWATVAFGISRMHELELKDRSESPAISGVEKEGFTEVYRTRSDEDTD